MLDKKTLEKFNQEHLIEFEKLMSSNEKEHLSEKLESLNLADIRNLYNDLYLNKKVIDDVSSVNEVKYDVKSEFTVDEIEQYEKLDLMRLKRQICSFINGWWSRDKVRLQRSKRFI